MAAEDDLFQMIARIEERLIRIEDILTSEVDDPNPWTFRLFQEYTSATDCDGNGLKYGIDFIFEENIENHPPTLHSLALDLRKSWSGKVITWEDYLNGLPDGSFKNNVASYVNSLNPKA